MVVSALELAKSTVSLLLFVGLGLFGHVESVEVAPRGLIVEQTPIAGVAFGDIAFHNGWFRDHEYGHLVHEDELGPLYLPLAGLSSALGNWMALRGKWTADDYFGMWTERKANEYGGVSD